MPPHKQLALDIFHEALEAISVDRAIKTKLLLAGDVLSYGNQSVDLANFDELKIVSLGCSSDATAKALVGVLQQTPCVASGRLAVEGIIATNRPGKTLSGFEVFQGGFPFPNEQSLAAAEAVLNLLGRASERTLVIFLISGGSEVLVEKPIPGIGFDDLVQLHHGLANCGAFPTETRSIFTHVSEMKGGRLAVSAAPATQISFIFSDAPTDHEETVGGGPTLHDRTTVATCDWIIKKYELLEKLPPTVQNLFQNEGIPETPKSEVEALSNCSSFVMLSNDDAVSAAHKAAEARGFHVVTETGCDHWPLEQATDFLLERLQNIIRGGVTDKPVCLISGGEVLSAITGEGRGGRNHAHVLHCCPRVSGGLLTILSASTNGLDGNCPSAGAVADGETLALARKLGMNPDEYFQMSDAYGFFDTLGDSIITGPLDSHVRDLRLILAARG